GISVSQTGDDFAVTNTAPDQTVSLADGGNGNVTIGGTYPNFTIDVPDATVDTNTEYTAGDGLNLTGTEFSAEVSSTAGNALSIDANGLYVSNVDNVDDADNDPTNELTQRGTGGPTGSPAEGTTYVDTASGQLYVYDSGAWQPVGGSATPGDASDTNELITSFSVVSSNLRITEAGTDFDVPLSDLGTDDQDLGLGTNGVANQSVEVTITDGAAALIDIRDADNDPNNEDQTVSAGTGISVNQVGDDFAVTNTAPDQTVSLADGGNGNV
ncbi:hypothetical protein, partial [Maribacter litoralis]|uniref:hypothetical protein n=1 Tax=Maribacter litoralis TaxID=2059726 RepID=UPI0013E01913